MTHVYTFPTNHKDCDCCLRKERMHDFEAVPLCPPSKSCDGCHSIREHCSMFPSTNPETLHGLLLTLYACSLMPVEAKIFYLLKLSGDEHDRVKLVGDEKLKHYRETLSVLSKYPETRVYRLLNPVELSSSGLDDLITLYRDHRNTWFAQLLKSPFFDSLPLKYPDPFFRYTNKKKYVGEFILRVSRHDEETINACQRIVLSMFPYDERIFVFPEYVDHHERPTVSKGTKNAPSLFTITVKKLPSLVYPIPFVPYFSKTLTEYLPKSTVEEVRDILSGAGCSEYCSVCSPAHFDPAETFEPPSTYRLSRKRMRKHCRWFVHSSPKNLLSLSRAEDFIRDPQLIIFWLFTHGYARKCDATNNFLHLYRRHRNTWFEKLLTCHHGKKSQENFPFIGQILLRIPREDRAVIDALSVYVKPRHSVYDYVFPGVPICLRGVMTGRTETIGQPGMSENQASASKWLEDYVRAVKPVPFEHYVAVTMPRAGIPEARITHLCNVVEGKS